MKTTQTIHDPYASRVGGEAEVRRRLDPVVHDRARALEAGLDPRALDSYERDGFAYFSGYFPPDLADELQREAQRLATEPDVLGADEVVFEPDSQVVRSLFRFERFSASLAAVCRDERLVRTVRGILGDDVYVHQTRINYKRGFGAREFYWHSDFETWHVEDGMPRMRAVSAAINLTPTTPHNGPLLLVPGSQCEYVACAGWTPNENYKRSLRVQEVGVPEDRFLAPLVERGGIEGPTGPPGSLLLFDCNTMHGSNSNITPWPRCGLFLVFNAVSNALHDPFGGTPPRPDYIGNRSDTAPIRLPGETP